MAAKTAHLHLDPTLHAAYKQWCHERGLEMKAHVEEVIRGLMTVPVDKKQVVEVVRNIPYATPVEVPQAEVVDTDPPWARPPFWETGAGRRTTDAADLERLRQLRAAMPSQAGHDDKRSEAIFVAWLTELNELERRLGLRPTEFKQQRRTAQEESDGEEDE